MTTTTHPYWAVLGTDGEPQVLLLHEETAESWRERGHEVVYLGEYESAPTREVIRERCEATPTTEGEHGI